ncbi:MAG: ABC transporter substrate-binding protein [Phycisphaerales bacterium]|nr:ABC transporter substrate-binding protein [Phycisphaerales bacterium]
MGNKRAVLRLGHSPDPDDAFMWWPIFGIDGCAPALDTGRFRFEPVMADIETLNKRSATGELEITAISMHQYPYVRDRYVLTSCGASMGERYGPKVVAREPHGVDWLRDPDVVVAIPGERTTAHLVLSLLLGPGTFRTVEMSFDAILDAVSSSRCEAGLIIHEGQLTYDQAGLVEVADLGAWWYDVHRLPLPLGGNAIRRDLEAAHGPGTLGEVTTLLHRSIRYALAHRDEGLVYAMRFARDMSIEEVDRFVGLYVTHRTVDTGDEGRLAIETLLRVGAEAGLTPDPGVIELIRPVAV